jgi:hypothetical protein
MFAGSCLLVACGGDESGEPLVSGSVKGSFDGMTFTAVNGFAAPYRGQAVIGVGDGSIRCGSENANDPPSGMSIVIAVPELAVGSFSNVLVEVYKNRGAFEGVGSNTGSLTLTSVTDASVAGMIAFSYTDMDSRVFTANGTFEVVNCPP